MGSPLECEGPECDHSDSFPFNFETNVISFGLKLNGKLPLRSNSTQFERKSILLNYGNSIIYVDLVQKSEKNIR